MKVRQGKNHKVVLHNHTNEPNDKVIFGNDCLAEGEETLVVDVLRIKYVSAKPYEVATREFNYTELTIEDVELKKKNIYFITDHLNNFQTDSFEVDILLKGQLTITKDINIIVNVPAHVKFEFEIFEVKK